MEGKTDQWFYFDACKMVLRERVHSSGVHSSYEVPLLIPRLLIQLNFHFPLSDVATDDPID